MRKNGLRILYTYVMDYGFLKMDCRFLKMDYGFVKMDYGLVKWIRNIAENRFEVL